MSYFIPNFSFGAWLESSPGVALLVNEGAAKVLAEARRLATPHVRSGDYIGSLAVNLVVEGGVVHGQLTTDSDHWWFVEFGTSVMTPQAILRQALESAGI